MKILSTLVPCILLAASASLTHATSIPIDNYSFTSPDLPGTYHATDSSTSNYDPSQTEEEYSLVPYLGGVGDAGSAGGGGATNGFIPDWTATTDGGVAGVDNPVDNPTAGMYPGTGGSPSDGVLPGTGDGYTFGLINLSTGQDGSFTYSGSSLGNFVIGDTYTLTLSVGLRLDQPYSPSYAIELLNDGVAVSTPTYYTTTSSGTFVDLPTFTFIDTADTGAIGIEILAENNGTASFEQANFDNVRLDETPEPSTYAEILGGCVLLGLVAWNRRRFRA
jgi:hypothetical protein